MVVPGAFTFAVPIDPPPVTLAAESTVRVVTVAPPAILRVTSAPLFDTWKFATLPPATSTFTPGVFTTTLPKEPLRVTASPADTWEMTTLPKTDPAAPVLSNLAAELTVSCATVVFPVAASLTGPVGLAISTLPRLELSTTILLTPPPLIRVLPLTVTFFRFTLPSPIPSVK